MSPKKPPLPPEDAALWAHVVQDVAPIHNHNSPPAPPVPDVAPAVRVRTHRLPQDGDGQKNIMPAADTPKSRDMDKNTRLKLERGQMPIEAVLDLHGKTFEHAQGDIYAFLQQSWRANLRCVLVVTGKGRGVLKTGFMRWVNEAPVRDIVLHAHPAQGRHGGGGAYYVLLRRQR